MDIEKIYQNNDSGYVAAYKLYAEIDGSTRCFKDHGNEAGHLFYDKKMTKPVLLKTNDEIEQFEAAAARGIIIFGMLFGDVYTNTRSTSYEARLISNDNNVPSAGLAILVPWKEKTQDETEIVKEIYYNCCEGLSDVE